MDEKKLDTVAHLEADPEKSTKQASIHNQVGDAQLANLNEHQSTVREALRAYPWAVVWTLIVLMSIIMEGTKASQPYSGQCSDIVKATTPSCLGTF